MLTSTLHAYEYTCLWIYIYMSIGVHDCMCLWRLQYVAISLYISESRCLWACVSIIVCHAVVGGYVWGVNTQLFFQSQHKTSEEIGAYMSWIPLVGGSLGAFFGGFISDRVVKKRGIAARMVVLVISQVRHGRCHDYHHGHCHDYCHSPCHDYRHGRCFGPCYDWHWRSRFPV